MIAATLSVLCCEEESYTQELSSPAQSCLEEAEQCWALSIRGQSKGRCHENVTCHMKKLSAPFPSCLTSMITAGNLHACHIAEEITDNES